VKIAVGTGVAPRMLNLGTEWEWSALRPCRFIPWEWPRRGPFDKRLGVHRSRYGREVNLLPLPVIERWFLACSARNLVALYWQRYLALRVNTVSLLNREGAEPFSRSRQLCSYSGISQHVMEPEGSLLCSKEPSIVPYPKPDKFSPYHPILSLRFILILSSHLCLDLASGLFSFSFLTKILLCIPHLRFAACYMPCPSHPSWLNHSNYIWRREQIIELLCTMFSHFLSLHPSSVRIFSAPCSRTPSVCVPPLMLGTKIKQGGMLFKTIPNGRPVAGLVNLLSASHHSPSVLQRNGFFVSYRDYFKVTSRQSAYF
jgi:hypothetical protein